MKHSFLRLCIIALMMLITTGTYAVVIDGIKETAAYRAPIKGVTPKLVPVATLLDKTVEGEPYVLTDEEAAPFLACNGKATVVIDYSLPTPVSGMLALVGASDKNANNHTFSIIARYNGSMGMRYFGLFNGVETWYTSIYANLGSGSHKMVVVMDPEVGYKYYADGIRIRDIAASALGDYGFAHFGNVSANTISLGGLVTSAGTTLGGKVNIKSLRLYDEPLTDDQIRDLSYDFSESGEIIDDTNQDDDDSEVILTPNGLSVNDKNGDNRVSIGDVTYTIDAIRNGEAFNIYDVEGVAKRLLEKRNVIVVWLSSGKEDLYYFSSSPIIKYDDDNIIIEKNNGTKKEYTSDQILRITYDYIPKVK